MFFWNSLAFSMIHQMLAMGSLVPLPFLKPAWTSGSSRFTYCWSLAWRIFQFAVIHTLIGFSVTNEAQLTFFWNSLGFFMIQRMLAIWFLVPLIFLNPACTSGSSRFTSYWRLTWRILSITLLVCESSTVALYFKHSLALLFFGTGMKTDLFQSYGHHWVFQQWVCWHIECRTFTAPSFRIWNSSTGNHLY